jgi:serine O-acetyltransferase
MTEHMAAEVVEFSRMPRRNERGYWRADLQRYPPGSFLLQPALWAIGTYRFGRWTLTAPRLIRPVVHGMYFLLYSVVRLATGIDMPRSVVAGPGLMIHHFGGVIMNPRVEIGRNCTLRHGVTLGGRKSGDDVPTVRDDVEFGAYAQILGNVEIGSGARIGALSLVLRDVEPGTSVAGVPAREIGRTK